MQLESKPKVNI